MTYQLSTINTSLATRSNVSQKWCNRLSPIAAAIGALTAAYTMNSDQESRSWNVTLLLTGITGAALFGIRRLLSSATSTPLPAPLPGEETIEDWLRNWCNEADIAPECLATRRPVADTITAQSQGNSRNTQRLDLSDLQLNELTEDQPALENMRLNVNILGYVRRDQQRVLVTAWERLSREPLPTELLIRLTNFHELSLGLPSYLAGLTETADFIHGGEPCTQLIQETRLMIEAACENDEFRALLPNFFELAAETCGDGKREVAAEIELQRKISMLGPNASVRDIINLLIGVKRCELVRKAALGIAQKKELQDQIEVLLGFQIQLAEALQLPISISSMHYHPMVQVSREQITQVGRSILEATQSPEQKAKILLKYPIWKKRMEQECEAQIEVKHEHYTNQLQEVLDDPNLKDHSKTLKAEEIRKKLGRSIYRILERATLQHLS